MPKVSVLIPAFRATFLQQALASVFTQGVDDFELVISDDSGGDEVRRVVERFRDSRIRYVQTAGRVGAVENCRQLWRQARYSLVKYLFDDDILLPNCLINLLEMAQGNPDGSYYFGHRQVIDECGRIIERPLLVVEDTIVRLDHATISKGLVLYVDNRIGELSNVLINASAGVGPDTSLFYAEFEMEVLGDVAFFLNATDNAPAYGLGQAVSGFRQHSQQQSRQDWNPKFAKGLCEWELFLRGEFARGVLDQEQALAAADALAGKYEPWLGRLVELKPLHAGLERLKAQIRAGDTDVFDEEFRRAWAEMNEFVARRVEAAQAGSEREGAAAPARP